MLANRIVGLVIASEIFMQTGIWIRNFAILLFVVEITGNDPFAVSMIYVAEFAPVFIFSFIGGTFADRWNPKRTMITSNLLSGLSIFIVFVTFFFGTWIVIFFATLVSSILTQFSHPAGLKLFKITLPKDKIQPSISLYQTIFSMFMVFGPILGTFIFEEFGIYVSGFLMGISFILASIPILIIPSEYSVNKESVSIFIEMLDGLRYVLSKKSLKLLSVCFFIAGLAVGLIKPTLIFLVTKKLGLDKEYLQWFLTFNGVGMIIGGIISFILAKKVKPQLLLICGMILSTISMFGVSASDTMHTSIAFLSIDGIALPLIQIGINTMILKSTDSEFVGRVNGILSPLFSGSLVFTMSLSGIIMAFMSVSSMYLLAGFLFLLGLFTVIPLYWMPEDVLQDKN